MSHETSTLHLGKRIEFFISKRTLHKQIVADMVGITRQQLYKICQNEDVNTAMLKKLADVFKIDLIDFFKEDDTTITTNKSTNDNNNTTTTTINNLKEENKLLKEIINDKQEIINLLKR